MIERANRTQRMGIRTGCIGAAWLLVPTIVWAAGANDALVRNPSFEAVATLAAPPPTNDRGQWALRSDLAAPTDWTLSAAFPGTLEIVDQGAADGQRFLRITAGPERAAHVAQPWAGLRRGLGYEVSVRYRGGPLELKVYEYDADGRLKTDRALARGAAAIVPADGWSTLSGVYAVPDGTSKVTLALAVPAGAQTDVDDVRIGPFERPTTPINVHDFDASGSEYEAFAVTTAGSKVLALDDIGDFRVNQQVTVSKCNPHIADGRIWGRSLDQGDAKFEEQIEAQGYDGTLGPWTVYLLDFSGQTPPSFRWSDDLGITWTGPVPVTGDWQELSGGVKLKLRNPDFWTTRAVVSFSGRDQLISTITAVEGNAVTLADPAPLEAAQCVVQHTDSGPLQRAFDRAATESRNVFIPSGCYRLTSGLRLNEADGITVEGENPQRTILDIRGGQGACLAIVGGTSVTMRNLRFRGFSGFAQRREMGHMRVGGYDHMWGFYVKHCSALLIQSPQRVSVEDCHATGMSAECFYSSSASRRGNDDAGRYTQSIVYRNCTVSDCARNAFNNNDYAENTAVLYCRIENVGGCSWEGASRFVKFVGNYVRNGGTVAMGNIRSRDASLDILPSGQHIVAHNTFEQQTSYGGCAIRSSAGSTPVVISNNLFINFNSSAIATEGFSDQRNLPAGNTIITGNAIDLTCVRDESVARTGILASADDTTISDNQVYIRGPADPRARGIVLVEPARNVVVHDNTIRGCATGLAGLNLESRVEEALDPRTFQPGGRLPWPRRGTHCFRGCRITWTTSNGATGTPAYTPGPKIEAFDPDAGVFRLAEDCDLKQGVPFAIQSPQGLNWNIHHNVVNNCLQLVNLDVFGGPTALFAHNLLSRGETDGVKVAVEIRGQFRITGNQFAGFDEPGSVALLVHDDPLGRTPLAAGPDNAFDNCLVPIQEGAAHAESSVSSAAPR